MSDVVRMADELAPTPYDNCLWGLAYASGEDWRVIHDLKGAARIPEARRCKHCQGTGNQLCYMYQRCEDCGGTGVAR